LQEAFRVFVIGITSVFLIMILLMVVLKTFAAIVRRAGQKRGVEGDRAG
jgi:Na+-transporting methylmalonyl-CoA/oxaloacetate decarboxylase gamma subunit